VRVIFWIPRGRSKPLQMTFTSGVMNKHFVDMKKINIKRNIALENTYQMGSNLLLFYFATKNKYHHLFGPRLKRSYDKL